MNFMTFHILGIIFPTDELHHFSEANQFFTFKSLLSIVLASTNMLFISFYPTRRKAIAGQSDSGAGGLWNERSSKVASEDVRR